MKKRNSQGEKPGKQKTMKNTNCYKLRNHFFLTVFISSRVYLHTHFYFLFMCLIKLEITQCLVFWCLITESRLSWHFYIL